MKIVAKLSGFPIAGVMTDDITIISDNKKPVQAADQLLNAIARLKAAHQVLNAIEGTDAEK